VKGIFQGDYVSEPVISVVIPAFRSGSLIREAIDSVLNQTFQDFEIVIVDNNASEETRDAFNEVAQENPGKIRVVSEALAGVCSARNRGILEGRGVYIALLDDDDKMYPDRLFKQILAFESNPDIVLVYGALDFVEFDGQTVVEKNKADSPSYWSKILLGDQTRYLSDPLAEPMPSVMLFKKEHAVKIGLFDERFNPIWLEDTEFLLRMWESGPFFFIPESLGAYRLPSRDFLRKKRAGISSGIQRFFNQDLFFSILVEKYYRNKDYGNIIKFKKIKSQWLRELSFEVFKYRDGKQIGRALLQRAMKSCPTDLKNWKWYLRSYLPNTSFLRSLKCQEYSPELLSDIADPEIFKGFFCLPED
jgi:glycosyltransferase involved in cell wall biosynthesis